MGTTNTLVEFWKEFDPGEPPHVHPRDREIILEKAKGEFGAARSFAEFVESPYFDDPSGHRHRLQLGVLPTPFVGDVERADIFLLLLNPGFGGGNYFNEYEVPWHRERKLRSLRNLNGEEDYPFMYLDPRFCWTSGFQYWEKKLHGIVKQVCAQERLQYRDALRRLSKRIALVQWLPYHSKEHRSKAWMRGPKGHPELGLPSIRASTQFVRETVMTRVHEGKAVVVVMRKANRWGVQAVSERVVVYGGGAEARGAALGPETRGGQLILERLRNPM